MLYDENANINAENHFITSTDCIDEPLLIVLDDDDDYDDNETISLTFSETNSNHILSNHDEQKTIVSNEISVPAEDPAFEVKNIIEHFSPESTKKSKVLCGSRKSSKNQEKSDQCKRTVLIDTSFTSETPHQRQQQRNKVLCRRKNLHKSNSADDMSNKNIPIDDNVVDSILSNISFDNVSNILTVSRMGSIYYCIEDLYLKVFSSLCTLDEFTYFLEKSGIAMLKQVTLSEKMSIEQQIPKLKKFNPLRYRLLSINSSDYLIKLKRLLKNKNDQRMDQIIEQMRHYKQTSATISLQDKAPRSPVFTKQTSIRGDDSDVPRKHLKIVTKEQKTNKKPQFGIFIQCNGPVNCNIFSTDETLPSTPAIEKPDLNISSKSILRKNDIIETKEDRMDLNNINVTKELFDKFLFNPTVPFKRKILNSHTTNKLDFSILSSTSARCLNRSQSLTAIQKSTKKVSTRTSSLPSMKFTLTENTPLNTGLKQSELIDLTDESCFMPMIVNVEENVQINNNKTPIKEKTSAENCTDPNHQPITAQNKIQQTTTAVSNHKKRKLDPNSKDPEQQPKHCQRSLISPSNSQHSLLNNNTQPELIKVPLPIPPSSYLPTPFYQTPSNIDQQEQYLSRHVSSTPISSFQHHRQEYSTSHHHQECSSSPNIPPISVVPSVNDHQYSSYRKPRESISNYHDTQPNLIVQQNPSSNINHNRPSQFGTNLTSSATTPIMREPVYHRISPPEQQISSPICRLNFCNPHQPTAQPTINGYSTLRNYLSSPRVPISINSDESINDQQNTYRPPLRRDTSEIFKNPNSYSILDNRNQRRIESAPYPRLDNHFAASLSNVPSSLRYPYSENPSMNALAPETEVYRPIPPMVVQNSSTLISPPNTPSELTLSNICTRSIDLQEAINEHGSCDMDKLPKLVVRHRKTYSNKTVDNMGQLFPTWFNEPDYRCIHCFSCDQVFTPQNFMKHVDDEQMIKEQPLTITSIQLLTSEKMSAYKVALWNQFCQNLTIYARDGRIAGFSAD